MVYVICGANIRFFPFLIHPRILLVWCLVVCEIDDASKGLSRYPARRCWKAPAGVDLVRNTIVGTHHLPSRRYISVYEGGTLAGVAAPTISEP